MRNFRPALVICLLAVTIFTPTLARGRALPKRDHLTPQEADLVRDAQLIDKRIDVFIRAAERRFLVLQNPQAVAPKQKDAEKWGELPKGTRAELLYDISKILDEAITNIDDVSSREPKNPLLPKALRKLAEACNRFLTQLTPLREQLKDERSDEREQLEQAIENAQEIIAAADKLPPPPAKK